MPDYRARIEDRTFVLLTAVASAASELQIGWLIAGGDFVMSVAGFQEAYDNAVQVLVNDTLMVRVVSPVGLLLLKLVAWGERHNIQPRKDAADIAYVLRHSPALFGETSLFEEHFEIVESAGYDLELAAARLLGQKMSALASERTRKHVCKLLEQELNNGIESKLVRQVAESLVPAERTRTYELLSQIMIGLAESRSQTT